VPPVQIDFEGGFDRDTVIVRSDGRELWRQDDVTTNLAVSLAAIAQLELREGADLEVEVPTRGLRSVGPVETPYVEVEIVGDQLVLRPTSELPMHL
jgi:hypothetical protein